MSKLQDSSAFGGIPLFCIAKSITSLVSTHLTIHQISQNVQCAVVSSKRSLRFQIVQTNDFWQNRIFKVYEKIVSKNGSIVTNHSRLWLSISRKNKYVHQLLRCLLFEWLALTSFQKSELVWNAIVSAWFVCRNVKRHADQLCSSAKMHVIGCLASFFERNWWLFSSFCCS